MRLYWEVARRAFRRHSTYRGATLARIFTGSVFGFIRAYVMVAVFAERTDIGGFDVTDAVTFVFLSQGFLVVTEAFGTDEIAQRIRSGDIVTDLYRPIAFQRYWLAQDLGRAAFHLVARGIPPVAAGALVFDFRMATDLPTIAAFAVSITCAVAVSFGLRFLINLSAFWLFDVRGAMQLMVLTQLFLAGLIVPITFFPAWLETLARATPFVGTLQVPAEILMGRHHGGDLLLALGAQLAWSAAIYVAGHALVLVATRKVIVQGG